MKICLINSNSVVLYVKEMLRNLPADFVWTMTISPGKSVGSYVITAIEGSSGVTGENSGVLKFSDEHHNT